MLIFVVAGACAGAPVSEPGPVCLDGHLLMQRASELHRKGRYLEALSLYRDILLNESAFGHEITSIAAEAIATMHRSYLNDNDTSLVHVQPLPRDIRVLIEESNGPVTVHAQFDSLIEADNGTLLMTLPAEKRIRLSSHDGSLFIDERSSGQTELSIYSPQDDAVDINGRRYCGKIRAYADNRTTMLVNILPLERYLEGVLPKEVSPSWPEQALCAQAIAARTYALYHMIKRRDEPFDVYATTSSQVFGGCTERLPSIHSAITATSGMILTRNGNVILALFHSNSGGMTGDAREIWGFERPYLHALADPHGTGRPGDTWQSTVAESDLVGCLKIIGLSVNGPLSLVPLNPDMTGRITSVKIEQAGRSFFLTGNSFRLIAGATRIKSTRFTVVKEKNSFLFSGKGYGHGAGMSQWGACSMAQKGYNFRQILQFYYPETRIDLIPDQHKTPEPDVSDSKLQNKNDDG